MPRIGAYSYYNGLTVFIDEDDVGDITHLTEFQKITGGNYSTNTVRVKYTPDELFMRAKMLIYRNPPDPFEAVNKVWMGLAFTLKKKCLRVLDLDLCSHCSHTVLCRFLIEAGTRNDRVRNNYHDTFKDAEKLHQQHYGRINFGQNELANIFKKVEELAKFIEGVDETNLKNKFNSTDISFQTCAPRKVDLAGYIFTCKKYVAYTTTTPVPTSLFNTPPPN